MMTKSKSDRRSLRAVTVALLGLLLVACGTTTTTTATESTDSASSTPDSTPSASPHALTRVAAETFPTVPGIVWVGLTRQDQKDLFEAFRSVGNLDSVDFRWALKSSGGPELAALVAVFRFTPQYSTPKALRAELEYFGQPDYYGQSLNSMTADVGGHDVLVFITPDIYNHFWISGDEIVMVMTVRSPRMKDRQAWKAALDDPLTKAFSRRTLLAAGPTPKPSPSVQLYPGPSLPPLVVEEGAGFTYGEFTLAPGWKVNQMAGSVVIGDVWVRNDADVARHVSLMFRFFKGPGLLAEVECGGPAAGLKPGESGQMLCLSPDFDHYPTGYTEIRVSGLTP